MTNIKFEDFKILIFVHLFHVLEDPGGDDQLCPATKANRIWHEKLISFFFFLFGLEKSNILRSSTCLLVRQVFGDCQVQVIQFLKTTFRQ